MNGLQKRSQIMIDKASTTQRDKMSPAFGHLDNETMLSVTRSLAVFLGVA
jgi:mRNA interferase MazF